MKPRSIIPWVVADFVLVAGPWVWALFAVRANPGAGDAQGAFTAATYATFVTVPLGGLLLAFGLIRRRG